MCLVILPGICALAGSGPAVNPLQTTSRPRPIEQVLPPLAATMTITRIHIPGYVRLEPVCLDRGIDGHREAVCFVTQGMRQRRRH